MLPVAHWLVSSPWAHLAEMLAWTLLVLWFLRPGGRLNRGRHGGPGKRPAFIVTNPSIGTDATRPTEAATNFCYRPGGLSEGKGFPRTRARASRPTGRGSYGSVTPIRGASGAQPGSAGYGDAA